jgi:3-dehydroquinate synthetase
MVAAARLSREKLGTDLLALHEDLLCSAGLSLRVPAVDIEKALSAIGQDKKRRAGTRYRFVLLEDVGKPLWGVPVGEEEVRRTLKAVVG